MTPRNGCRHTPGKLPRPRGVPLKNIVILLLPLFILALVGCAAPVPTPDIPATVTAQVQEQVADREAAAPAPATTAAPLTAISLPSPTPTITPTLGSTPTPTTSIQERVQAGRVLTINDLQGGPQFWQDKEDFVLVGCITRADMGGRNRAAFSWDGGFSRNDYIVEVLGFSDRLRLPTNTCYQLLVKYNRTETYCLTSSLFSPAPPVYQGNCPGWKQAMPRFVIPDGNSGAQQISKAEWREFNQRATR